VGDIIEANLVIAYTVSPINSASFDGFVRSIISNAKPHNTSSIIPIALPVTTITSTVQIFLNLA
jgi:hypothetical protein